MQTILEAKKTNRQKTLAPIKRAIFYAFEDCQHAVFFNVGWNIYEELIEKYDGIGNPRLYYDKGALEIMPYSPEHETPIFDVYSLIEQLARALRLNCLCIGQSTLRRKSARRGFEPDSGYYFGSNAAKMRGKKRLDLQIDPAPDLIVEIDVTSPSTNKIELFAALGIGEVWIFENKKIKMLRLEKNSYKEISTSAILQNVSGDNIIELLDAALEMPSYEWQDKVSAWAAENLRK